MNVLNDETGDNQNNSAAGKRTNMYFGANPMLFDLAERLRANMTEAEAILWNIIKFNDWHLKFRRQHPISNYIADFYCHQVKLVIELDGGYHENKDVKIYDAKREADINKLGIRIIRFKNEELLENPSLVVTKIGEIVTTIRESLKENKSEAEPTAKKTRRKKERLFVIKIGGQVIDDSTKLEGFLKALSTAVSSHAADPLNNSPSGDGGLGDGGRAGSFLLIHGGGKIATKIGDQLGIESKYINGRRITDEATIDLVTMVYGGLVNKKIVAQLQGLNCNAIGLTGADANIIPAAKRPVKDVDYGFVGDVNPVNINVAVLSSLLQQNIIPVIAPLTHDGNGQMLNTNADTIASSLAVALSEMYDVRLIYCFEKNGILTDVNDEDSVIDLITKEKYQQLLHEKKLFDGIIPKIDNAFAAIDNGVHEVLIGHANDLLQNLTNQTKGTLIK